MHHELPLLVEAHELAAHFQRHRLIAIVFKGFLHFTLPVAEIFALLVPEHRHQLISRLHITHSVTCVAR